MAQRLELQSILTQILGTSHVYFQPPPDIKMVYPCIIYQRDNQLIRYANDLPYSWMKRYQITVIDKDPDSDLPDKVAQLPLCSYDRFFTADNLNHDVFQLFF